MFVCAGASHVHGMSNLNQAEIEEFMNELSPPHPFPHWQCLVPLLKSQQGQTLVHSVSNLAGLFQQEAGGVEGLRPGVGALCVYQCV